MSEYSQSDLDVLHHKLEKLQYDIVSIFNQLDPAFDPDVINQLQDARDVLPSYILEEENWPDDLNDEVSLEKLVDSITNVIGVQPETLNPDLPNNIITTLEELRGSLKGMIDNEHALSAETLEDAIDERYSGEDKQHLQNTRDLDKKRGVHAKHRPDGDRQRNAIDKTMEQRNWSQEKRYPLPPKNPEDILEQEVEDAPSDFEGEMERESWQARMKEQEKDLPGLSI